MSKAYQKDIAPYKRNNILGLSLKLFGVIIIFYSIIDFICHLNIDLTIAYDIEVFAAKIAYYMPLFDWIYDFYPNKFQNGYVDNSVIAVAAFGIIIFISGYCISKNAKSKIKEKSALYKQVKDEETKERYRTNRKD